MEHGQKALEATIASAREISFTIISMTISLAAVFIPLVFMPGLVGRIFREFAVTIVVAIVASGLVSLTLTPLMCARMLSDRGKGSKQTWMERKMSAWEKSFLERYSRALWWFLRFRWVSALIWVVCLAGTVWLSRSVRKLFCRPATAASFLG
jgi:multidrug efflux pump subunit AcrB